VRLEFSIDWISATIHQDSEGYAVNEIFGVFDDCGTPFDIKPMHGYSQAMRWKHGAIAMKNPDRPEMGVHVIMSGETLRELSNCGYDQLFLFKMLARAGAKFSIIHLALDVYDGGYEPRQMYADLEQKLYTGRARAGSQVAAIEGGYTTYVGSWNSDRFFRYYDKAKERGVAGDWKRLELILRGTYARALAHEAKDVMSIDELAAVMRGTVKVMANMNDERFQAFMSGEGVKLALPIKKANSTRNWLLTQVVSAIARYIVETGDEKIIDDMGAEITTKYQELIKK